MWLLALATLPAVWWLHRFHEPDRAHTVAALFLWPDRNATGERRQLPRRTDPLWWLRALTVALVVLALSKPHWSETDSGPLVIWVDDSASMFAQEQGVSRLQQALATLEAQLNGKGYTSITLRSLAAPGEQLVLNPRPGPAQTEQLRRWTADPRGEPRLPAPVAMETTSTHWLISDGASPGLTQWVRQAPIDRVLQVGESTENVAVTALSLRPDSTRTGSAELLVTIANGGNEVAGRQLEIYSGSEKLSTVTITVPPGGSMRRLIPLSGDPVAPITARMNRADALALDDSLTLSDAALRTLPVTVAASCGIHLLAALKSHPWLGAIEDKPQATGLKVYCATEDKGDPGPALYSGAQGGSVPVQGPLLWHPDAGHLRELVLDPAWLSASPLPNDDSNALELLANPEGALLMLDPERRVIVSRLDLTTPELVIRPEFPLLVAGMVDLLMDVDKDSHSLPNVAATAPARIAPQPLLLPSPPLNTQTESRFLDLTGTLVSAAILSLLLDLALVRRRLRTLVEPAKVVAVR